MKGEYLIIDEGNTRCKAALFQDDDLVHLINEASVEDLHLENLTASKVLFSSVRRTDTPNFLEVRFPQLYHWSNTGELPFPSEYKTPQTLGRDRIANVMAILQLGSPNTAKVAIDLGSCITFDVVNQDGVYTGGSISPGFNMQFKALHNYTGQLPLITPTLYNSVVGQSTEESMKTGVLTGTNQAILGFMNALEMKYNTVEFFITGGEAKYFDFPNKNHIFANQNLTLIGLKEILKHT